MLAGDRGQRPQGAPRRVWDQLQDRVPGQTSLLRHRGDALAGIGGGRSPRAQPETRGK